MRTALAFLLAVLLAGCASVEPRPAPLTRDDLVGMAKAGEPAQAMIQALEDTRSVMMLSASDIVRLHQEGVPQEVLDHLQRAQMEEIRRREALARMHAWPLYASPWPLYATPWRCPPWPSYRYSPHGWRAYPF
jgi:hypothetical protein